MSIEVWPVIHLSSLSRALRCAQLAVEAQCAGVMLISMDGHDEIIDPIAEQIRESAPGLKIGANYISLSAYSAMIRSQERGYDATWTDRQEFMNGEVPRHISRFRAEHRRRHLFFGAVAFKGQPHDAQPGRSARLTADNGMIPTTSGPATGTAPDVDKIKMMRNWLDVSHPLAIASGVTPENVEQFKPYVTHILVATGISSSFYEFDRDKLMRLMEKVR